MKPLAPSPFPGKPTERDLWVLERRRDRVPVTADRPYAFLSEQERFADGTLGDVATIFLTNRECPWRCVMCDLWRHTLPHPVAAGDIPRQIEHALQRLPPSREIKLYNSGSFFDNGAIPPAEDAAIAALLRPFERVIVECHPALVGKRCFEFADRINGQLEVAMGLETAHSIVLEKLNKRMTLDQYAQAASCLTSKGIALRSFVLVQPPFMPADEALLWACRSIDFAQGCGATVVSLIPTRGGNGATDDLAQTGDFMPPTLSVVEQAQAYGVNLNLGRVFLDLWDFDRLRGICALCRTEQKQRLQRINLRQRVEAPIVCRCCGGTD